MITSKQRSFLRAMSNKIEALFQLGKGEIDDNFLDMIDSALEARELIKIHVLENSEYNPREASNIICEKLNCEGIQSIGNKFVLYRKSQNKSKIELPK